VTTNQRSDAGRLFIGGLRRAFVRKGIPESKATQIAFEAVKKWAAGGGAVTPATRALSVRALEELRS
jgi:hypothetical protein